MKKVIVMSMVAVFLTGCYLYSLQAPRNRDNLNKLEVGMTKEQILQIMGKPYRREAEGQDEWLLYVTEAPLQRDSDLTPLLIEDGKLVGWGKNYWTTKEQRYELHEGQELQVTGISVPVWYVNKITSEPAKEVFCNYYLKNTHEDIPIKILEDGYEIYLPMKKSKSSIIEIAPIWFHNKHHAQKAKDNSNPPSWPSHFTKNNC